MKSQSITEFYPFENYATFDRARKLRWNNNAILQAIQYINTVYGREVTYDDLLDGVIGGGVDSITALLYGAVVAADPRITFSTFGRIYKPENITEYMSAVVAGLKKYMPEPEVKDTGENLDESWPDTQAEVKKNKEKPLRTLDTGYGPQKASSASRSKKSSKRPSGQS